MEIIIFGILILLSAFFSATETAFFSLHPSQVRLLEQHKKKNADIVAKLKHDSQRFLITILVGNSLANILSASLATVVATQYFGSAAIGIATGVTTFFVLIFGEIIPKSIAITHSRQIALFVSRPMYALYVVLYPLSTLIMKLTVLVGKMMGGAKTQVGVTEEEIRVMAHMSAESGHIDPREREMIENIFRFDDIAVGDVITPLDKIEFLNGTVPVDQIAHFVSQSGHSRYPVYDNNDTEDIRGYVHVNTIMRVLNSEDRDRLVKELVSPVRAVDEEMKIERVFLAMKKDKSHMFLVHRHNNPDDILGLVTLEDIVEEIVGEIEDETDSLD